MTQEGGIVPSVMPLLALLISVLLVLAIGGTVLVRRFWRTLSLAAVSRTSWVEDWDMSDRRTPPPGPNEGVPVPTVRWRWAGMAVGVVGAVVVSATLDSAVGAMVAWPVVGLGVLAGTFAGELTVPAPTGPVRMAQLRVRRLLDYIPRGLGALLCVATTVLFALAAVTTAAGLSGGRNAMDRNYVCVVEGQTYTYGPWPGAYYTAPVLSVVVVGLVLAGVVLRRVVRRPRLTDIVQVDDISRRRSAEMVTAAAGVLVLTPLLGIAMTARLASWSPSTPLGCDEPLWAFTGPALSALAFAAFVATAWCAGFLLLPSARSAGRREA